MKRRKTNKQIAIGYLKLMEIDMPNDLLPMFERSIMAARNQDPTIETATDFQVWVRSLTFENESDALPLEV